MINIIAIVEASHTIENIRKKHHIHIDCTSSKPSTNPNSEDKMTSLEEDAETPFGMSLRR